MKFSSKIHYFSIAASLIKSKLNSFHLSHTSSPPYYHIHPPLSYKKISLSSSDFFLISTNIFFFFSLSLFFSHPDLVQKLAHCRYGRVQSVKIIASSGGGNDTSPTSTTESCCQTTADHLMSSTNHSHHLHIHHRYEISHGKGSDGQQPAIGICAQIAFMDIKSASKAHLAEHKFDDRILTTEYYEPSTMQLHSESLVIGGKSENVVAGDMKESMTAHQAASRFTSTSSSHGLVELS